MDKLSSRAQVAEDWLFAYTNAHEVTRPAMWPHLQEAVEELIEGAKRTGTQKAASGSAGESSHSNLAQ